jgi:hypothetical protein
MPATDPDPGTASRRPCNGDTAGSPCWLKIAQRECVDGRYGSRMVNLTNLASDIVALVLNETLPAEVTQFDRAVARWRCGRSKDCGSIPLCR